MTALVIAEHNNKELKPVTLNTVTAACELEQDVHILVAGHGCASVAEQAAKISGVSKVLLVEAEAYENFLAENVASLISNISGDYDFILRIAKIYKGMGFKDQFMQEIVLQLLKLAIQKKS